MPPRPVRLAHPLAPLTPSVAKEQGSVLTPAGEEERGTLRNLSTLNAPGSGLD